MRTIRHGAGTLTMTLTLAVAALLLPSSRAHAQHGHGGGRAGAKGSGAFTHQGHHPNAVGYGGTWGGYYPYWGYDSSYGGSYGYSYGSDYGYGIFSGSTGPYFGGFTPAWGAWPTIPSNVYAYGSFSILAQ